MPSSAKVGTAGSCASRRGWATASARSLPLWMKRRAAARSHIMAGSWPPATSASAGAAVAPLGGVVGGVADGEGVRAGMAERLPRFEI